MLISRKRVAQQRDVCLKTLLPNGTELRVDTIALDSGVQMMHENESCILSDDTKHRIIMQNHGGNKFSLMCFEKQRNGKNDEQPVQSTVTPFGIFGPKKSPNNFGNGQRVPFSNVLWYMHKEMIPIYSECSQKSSAMQNVFGKLDHRSFHTESSSVFKRVPNSFLQDNVISIGMLLDILNCSDRQDKKKSPTPQNTKPAKVYSAQYVSRMLYLSSIFCATAPADKKNSLYHVSQGRMSEMPDSTQALVINDIPPEKNHLSLLLKGDDKEMRIMRCNLTVRKISAQSEFVKKILPGVMAMNASAPRTDAVFVSGVYSGRGALIYINSDTEDENSHKAAINSFALSENM